MILYQRKIGIGIVIIAVVLWGAVLITTPTLVLGYFPLNATKPTPFFNPSMQRQAFHQLLGMVYIRHDNATNQDLYYLPRNSPLGTFAERYMEQLETYALTAVPSEVGDKILHVIQQNRTALFSPTEYAKPEKLPPIPPGLPPLPKPPSLTQNTNNNNTTR
jgi:hypothetical protein